MCGHPFHECLTLLMVCSLVFYERVRLLSESVLESLPQVVLQLYLVTNESGRPLTTFTES